MTGASVRRKIIGVIPAKCIKCLLIDLMHLGLPEKVQGRVTEFCTKKAYAIIGDFVKRILL